MLSLQKETQFTEYHGLQMCGSQPVYRPKKSLRLIDDFDNSQSSKL